MEKVLVVDDEENIRALLTSGLTRAGFEVTAVGSAEEALQKAGDVDLVVLDLMLPGIGGMETARSLRSAGNNVPVVFLTARDEVDVKIEGLSLGDDYVTKPFSVEEFVARVQAVLRRNTAAPVAASKLEIGDLVIDFEGHQVWRKGQLIDLTNTEYQLLTCLAENPGRVYSKQEILKKVWGYEFAASGVVDTYVSYLRRKADPDRKLIHTVRGAGHVLREE